MHVRQWLGQGLKWCDLESGSGKGISVWVSVSAFCFSLSSFISSSASLLLPLIRFMFTYFVDDFRFLYTVRPDVVFVNAFFCNVHVI